MTQNQKVNSLVIAGTDYDRRRKVTKAMQAKMMKMVEAGKSISSIAETFGVSTYAVKTNTDKKFKKAEKKRLSQYACVSNTPVDTAELKAYKAQLLKSRKKVEVWVK